MFAIKKSNGTYFSKICDGFGGPRLIFSMDNIAVFYHLEDQHLKEVVRQISRAKIFATLVELNEGNTINPIELSRD
jgi:hypothetical protein